MFDTRAENSISQDDIALPSPRLLKIDNTV